MKSLISFLIIFAIAFFSTSSQEITGKKIGGTKSLIIKFVDGASSCHLSGPNGKIQSNVRFKDLTDFENTIASIDGVGGAQLCSSDDYCFEILYTDEELFHRNDTQELIKKVIQEKYGKNYLVKVIDAEKK